VDWQDKGIVLCVSPHGETSAIVELLTRTQGRHLGLVRGGRSRRHRPVLQPGNVVEAVWRARLSEHLGAYSLEMQEPYAALALDEPLALAGLNTLTGLARLLPERDPHAALYDASLVVLQHLDQPAVWPGLLVRWEMALLKELGFGLDLDKCAATGSTGDLAFVSPKSARAVSREAGVPYAAKLLRLPAFLTRARDGDVEPCDITDGFRLTGFFLERHVLSPRNIAMPEARQRLIAALEQATPLR